MKQGKGTADLIMPFSILFFYQSLQKIKTRHCTLGYLLAACTRIYRTLCRFDTSVRPSVHPSVTFFFLDLVIEISIPSIPSTRTFKEISFSILYHYRTLKLESVLSLSSAIYNHRPHSSLYKLSPHLVHFDTHFSSLVARLNHIEFTRKQFESMTLHSKLRPSQRMTIGSTVKVRVARGAF